MPQGPNSFVLSGAECATVLSCTRAAGLPRQEHTKLQVLVLLLCLVYQPRVAPWECVFRCAFDLPALLVPGSTGAGTGVWGYPRVLDARG